jgi:hypothetical protein
MGLGPPCVPYSELVLSGNGYSLARSEQGVGIGIVAIISANVGVHKNTSTCSNSRSNLYSTKTWDPGHHPFR